MTFSELEEKISELNRINANSNITNSNRYHKLFWELYDELLILETNGEIIRGPEKKNLNYLTELLEKDGPEYAYTIEFWPREDANRKYKIGVCVRGLPILKREY